MPPLLEIEALSMPMSGKGGGSVNDCIDDGCGGGVGGLVDEESHDTCKGEWEAGGGERLMDGVVVVTSGIGGGGRIRSMGKSMNGACGVK